MKKSCVLLAFAAVAMAAMAARAQSAPSNSYGLPPGLIRQGNVIMMQPIEDSEGSGSGTAVFGGERRTGTVRYLSTSDRDLLD